MATTVSDIDWQVRFRRRQAIRGELERVGGPGLLLKSCPSGRGPHAVRVWEPGDVAQWSRRFYAVRVLQRLRAAPAAVGERRRDREAVGRAIAIAEMLGR